MISPDFRATDVPPLLESFKTFIVNNHGTPSFLIVIGDNLYKDLEADFQRVHQVRSELSNAIYHRSDPDQLRKFKGLFLE